MFIIPQYIIISKHIENLLERAQEPTDIKFWHHTAEKD